MGFVHIFGGKFCFVDFQGFTEISASLFLSSYHRVMQISRHLQVVLSEVIEAIHISYPIIYHI